MLGLVPPIIGFFGVPFEVRHVTLVAGQIAASAHKLGAQVLHQPAFGWAVAGIVITGLMNLTFSFTLAFRLALTAQNVPAVDRRRVYIALAWRALRGRGPSCCRCGCGARRRRTRRTRHPPLKK